MQQCVAASRRILRPERGEARTAGVYFLQLAAVAFAYFAAGRLGLAVPFTSGNVSPVWPPAGIALAALLLLGNEIAPAIAVGAFLVNLLSGILPLTAAGIGMGSTLGALAGAALLRKIPGFEPSLTRLRDVLGLCTFAALGGTAISATFGVMALTLGRVHAWAGIGSAWTIWWLGDAMGILLVAPLLLTVERMVHEDARGRWPEFLILLAATVCFCLFLFDSRLGFGIAEDTFGFAVFPLVIWAAVRFGVGGAASTAAIVSAVAIWETAAGYGPFVRDFSPVHNAAILQSFLAVISLSGLSLAAAIAERQRAERALQRQIEEALATASQGLHLAQQTASIGTWEWNIPAGRITWSPELEQIHGIAPGSFDGRYDSFLSSVHPDDRQWVQQAVQEALTRQSPYDVEYRSVRPDGNVYWTSARGRVVFDAEGRPLKMVGICMDITSRKQAEEALRRSEKLAATGRLAATMAHEINNPLEAVTNLLYLACNDPFMSQRPREYLLLADQELRRVSHIAKQTLGFYRDTSSPKVLEVGQTLDEVLLIYEKKLQAKALNIRKKYAPDASVLAVAGDVRQVLSNLVANAIDACSEGGTLVLRVANSRDWKQGERMGVRVSIADNGCGISEEQRGKVFEPFFTTKRDIGTGLGLWVSNSIVEKHGGFIRFRTRSGSPPTGTIFSVFLPHTAQATAA